MRRLVFALLLGLFMLAGAWQGSRVVSIAYLRAPSNLRRARDRRQFRRALGDFNVLAMAGCVSVILGLSLASAVAGLP